MERQIFKGLRGLGQNIYISLLLKLLLVAALYTVCRIAYYLFNTSLFPAIDAGAFLLILAGGLKFDISAILYTNSLYIASQIIPFKFRHHPLYQKITAGIFYVVNGLALVANIADIAYYPFTLKRTTFTVFSQFSGEQNRLRLLSRFLFDYWYLLLLLVVLVMAMVWLYKRIGKHKVTFRNPVAYYLSSLLMIPVVAGLFIAGARGGFRHSTRPITLSNAGEYVENPAEQNIVLNTPFALLRTIKTKSLKKEQFFSQQQLDSLYNPLKAPDSSAAPFIKKNVVVILLESFSREYLGGFNRDLEGGKYKGYTPFLDSLMERSLVFTNAYANGRKSIEGLPSVLASIPGIQEPFVLSDYSYNRINSFGNLLSAEGYHTSFFHGAPNGSMGFSSFVKMAGIKNYYGMTEYDNDDDFDGMWGIWDEPFMQFWAQNLNRFKQPFFSALFSVSSHHPFKIPEKYEGRFPEGTLPVHRGVGYTDFSLKQFFKTASRMPWYRNTLFVITADHSSVAWHEEYKTSLGAYAVPIMIYDPSGDLKGRNDQPVQQADILPTVLNYLHYKKPYFAFGNDMIRYSDDHPVIHFTDGLYQIIMGDFVLMFDGEKSVEMYNYRSDRLLSRNIINTGDPMQNKLEMHVKAFIQQYNAHMIDNTLTVNHNSSLKIHNP
ncbi:phosphoglycerol transferase MdoB-like AlkP superfamily enzyme [Arcticibacter tournemirensis]|uniref:LTA synthase family protein n=1 Tax=Arcticibacter tournemirensis TaxID=699437 RepID=UPI001170DF63|nr:LTA synthase family protein [Arcticibacter tournemirensis]TQM49451.1 phosphoglycerol transferase MdoB-like AlkP superfamily enzyme [Arcticibacter tournemirensis]